MGVAFWVVLAEYQDWRLIISARQLDALDFRAAYRLVYDALAPGFRPEIPADHDPSDDRSLY